MNHTHWLSHKSNCSSCSFLNTLWSLYSTIQSWVVSSTISVIFSPTSVKKSYGKGDLNSSEDATREAMQKRRNQAHSCPSAQHGKKSRVRSHAKATRTYDWPNKKEIEEEMSKKKKNYNGMKYRMKTIERTGKKNNWKRAFRFSLLPVS